MKRFDIDWNGDVKYTSDGVLCFYSDHTEKLKEKDAEIKLLEDFIHAAFQAHPNLDLDINFTEDKWSKIL